MCVCVCVRVYRVFPRGGKAAGPWRRPPTPSTAEVKERVELYRYSPFGPSWTVLGWTFPLPLFLMDCWPTHTSHPVTDAKSDKNAHQKTRFSNRY